MLLTLDKRQLLIPRAVKGGIGQSNVWYADQPESLPIVEKVLTLIGGDVSSELPDLDGGPSGFEGTPRLVAHLRREVETKLDDLAIVCCNCHRMIHQPMPMLAVPALKKIVRRRL